LFQNLTFWNNSIIKIWEERMRDKKEGSSLLSFFTNRKQPKNKNASRAAVVDALNKALEIFVSHNEKTFDEVMTKGIRPVADALGLDRVVFYTLMNREEVKRLGQVYRWDKVEGGLTFLDDELKVLPDIPVIKNWISITTQGGSVRIRESDYTKEESAFCAYTASSQ
jgi:hypothetical protein